MYFTEQENLLIFENKYYPLIVRSTATKKRIIEVASVGITVAQSFGWRLTLWCQLLTFKCQPWCWSTSESRLSRLGRLMLQCRPLTHQGRPWLPQCNWRLTPRRLRRCVGIDLRFIGVCVYVYIHTHTHKHTFTHTHTNTHSHTHNPHTYTYTHTHNTHT